MIYDNTQYFNLFNNEQSIEYFSNFFEFIFENIEKNKYFKELKILYSIFHNSLFNINKGNYKYLNNIQNLLIPINYKYKDNNITINKNDINNIISYYSIEDINKKIQILNKSYYNVIKEELEGYSEYLYIIKRKN